MPSSMPATARFNRLFFSSAYVGIEVITSLDQADAYCCDRMFERNGGSVKSRGRANDRVHRGINVGIRGENQRDHLCFVLVAFGKERPNRPIDHAAVQNFTL